MLAVGRKVVKKFSDVAKNRENVAEKCGEEKLASGASDGSRTSLLKRVVSL